MKRRIIPVFLALVALLVCLLPLYTDTEVRAMRRYTLPIAAGVFALKAILFAWMRQRMVTDTRRLTVFGKALVDFFTGLTLMSLVWTAVYFVVFWRFREHRLLTPSEQTVITAGIISSGAWIVASGIAVAFEMRRAGIKLAVHEDRSP